MPANPFPDSLQEQLNRLAAQGARRLKRWVLRCACDRYLQILFPAALCVSTAILLAELLERGGGIEPVALRLCRDDPDCAGVARSGGCGLRTVRFRTPPD